MIALAAVLWLAYLVPSWFRSRQYLATERNAVRLQQTLRILAETAEVPDEVRIEANARSIAEQERILKHRAAVRELEAIPTAVRTADRLRRSRAITAAVFALSLAVAVLGGMQAVYTGAWIILIGGVIASVASLSALVKLAKAGRRLKLPRPVHLGLASPELVDHSDAFADDEPEERVTDELAEYSARSAAADADADTQRGWVPVAVPRQRYQAHPVGVPLGLADEEPLEDEGPLDTDRTSELADATARAAVAHRQSLLKAAAEAETALRARLDAEHATVAELPVAVPSVAAAVATPVAAVPVAAVPAGPPSRFARMGIVDGDTSSHLDLDEILARRRAG